MRLQVLCEDHRYNINITRNPKVRKEMAKLGFKPPPRDYIMAIAKDGNGKIIGFVATKPYINVASNNSDKHMKIDPNYEGTGLMRAMMEKLTGHIKDAGFSVSKTRSSSNNSDITEVYGDHVSSIKYPTKTVNIHKIDHSAVGPRSKLPPKVLGRPIQKTPGRAGPIYKS